MDEYLRYAFLFVCIWLMGCQDQKDNKEQPGTFQFKTVSLTDLEGNALDPKLYQNKTVFLNFWATWCKPCLKEMPGIAALQEKTKDKPVVFLFATDDEPASVYEFAQNNSFDFKYVRIQNLDAIQVGIFPTTCIFDKEGNLQFRESGYRNWDNEESTKLLNQIIDTND